MSDMIDWDKGGGLVPAIVQDSRTLQVLMLGYMNKESYEKTLSTNKVTFYSRSRQTLWTKGETSGNILSLVSITPDCDSDTLLVMAYPHGPTCHEGTTSCFGEDGAHGLGWLAELEAVISERKTADPSKSYSAKLLNGPIKRAAQKVGEEGVEVALAAMTDDLDELKNESADLIYHLIIVLTAKGLTLRDIVKTLKSRSS